MKAIGWLIGIVLALIIGLGVYLVVFSGDLLKQAVETLGPRYLGVDVRLGAAEISVAEGTGELRGLVIGNPPGFDGPHALSLGRVALGLDPLGQSRELVVVKRIEVDAADLAIVARGRQTNLQKIMSNLEAGGSDTTAEETAGEEPRIIIDRFDFTNARTTLDSDLLGSRSVSIPDVHLEGIGRKSQGVTIREALVQLLRPIVRASTTALAGEGLELDQIKAGAQERLDRELEDRLGGDLKDLKERLKN